jgi:hypothetical protein
MAAKIDRITCGRSDWFEEGDGETELQPEEQDNADAGQQPEKDNAEARRARRSAEAERREKGAAEVRDAKFEFSHNILGPFR